MDNSNADSPSLENLDVIIISHTHWDREWYRPYQHFRLQLVEMLDHLLEIMLQCPDLTYFFLDGQSVLLEDYLALRPEQATTVRSLVQTGRLGIGPWYVQPDEFLVSGEALIRNLLFGHYLANQLGGVVKDGWLPDTFGHVAQLPQILRNFGIQTFVFARGLGQHLAESRLEFWWQAPNGDRVLALHQAEGYWNASNLGYPSFWGDSSYQEPDVDLALAQVTDLVAKLAPQASTSTIAIWNGADHMPCQESLPDLIRYLNEHLTSCQVRQGSVSQYAAAVREAEPCLQTVRGELRGSRFQGILHSTLSSRIYLKQANHRTQRLLEREAEPLATMAWLLGEAYPEAQLREAWRLLLQNHAHDSICGCSIDQVHREMMMRFDQAEQIGVWIAGASLEAMAKLTDTTWCSEDGVPVLVFNPLGQPRREVVELHLRLPWCEAAYQVADHRGQVAAATLLAHQAHSYDWLCQRLCAAEIETRLHFWRQCLIDIDGLDIVAFEWQSTEDGVALHVQVGDRPLGSDPAVERLLAECKQWSTDTEVTITATYHAVSLAFMAEVPACGYALYAVQGGAPLPEAAPQVRGGTNWLENEYLRVEVDGLGQLSLTDRSTGRSVSGAHRFEDCADIGDLYDFCPLPTCDGELHLERSSCHAEVAPGGLLVALRVANVYRVPESLAPDRLSRSVEEVKLHATSLLRLRAGSPTLEIWTTIDNQALDHRLRVQFPTGIAAETVYADGHFAVLSHPAVPVEVDDWTQPPSGISPHHTWFGTSDGRRGLVVLSEGLPEHEALPSEGGLTLALTLLRAVGQLSCSGLTTRPGQAGPSRPTPDAQCLGTHRFRYGIVLYEGDPWTAGLPHLASSFDSPLLAQPISRGEGHLPPTFSFVALNGEDLMLSALKRNEAGDGAVVRFYNAGESTSTPTVRFGLPVDRVQRASAEEIELAELESIGARQYRLQVQPAEIVSLLVEPRSVASQVEPPFAAEEEQRWMPSGL
jgi:alpha-mannosidase